MRWILDVTLALVVVGVESAAYLFWAGRRAMVRWAHPWKGDGDAFVVWGTGSVLVAAAGFGFFAAGLLVTAVAEIAVTVFLVVCVIVNAFLKVRGPGQRPQLPRRFPRR